MRFLLTIFILSISLAGQCEDKQEGKSTLSSKDLVVVLTEENFQREVEKSTLPVIVDVYATWCGPCRAVAPIFSDLSKEMKGKVKFVKLNIEESPSIAKKLGIRGMPTFLFIKNGEEVARHMGFLDRKGFSEKMDKVF